MIGMLWRTICNAIGFAIFLLPLVNLALVATERGAVPRSPVVLWSKAMDPILANPEGNFRFVPGWLWEPRPGSVIDGDLVNSLGARGPETTVERNTKYRIVVVGDDQPAGHMLAEAKAWPRELENQLRAIGIDVEVLNFGVPGHTAIQTTSRFVRCAPNWQPDLVLVSTGLFNEFSVSPSGYSDLELPYIIDSIEQKFARTLMRSTLAATIEDRLKGALRSSRSRRDCLRCRPIEVRTALSVLASTAKRNGSKLAIVMPWRKPEIARSLKISADYDAAIRAAAEQEQLPIIDLPASFEKVAELKLVDFTVGGFDSYFLDTFHVSARGSGAIAIVVALHLRKLKLVPPPTLQK